MHILFKTIAGSRLYGLAHEGSDWDYYTVIDKPEIKKARYATHSIVDGLDSVVVDFGTWVGLCQKGSPMALEAMFSQKAEIDKIAEFRNQFVAGTNYDAYLGVMKVMRYKYPESFKHKRHILRLAFNLQDLMETGRFNPTLDPVDIELINSLAGMSMLSVYNDALALVGR